jgi:hypothetical protein
MHTQTEVKLLTIEAMPGARVTAVHGLAVGKSTAHTHAPTQKTLRAMNGVRPQPVGGTRRRVGSLARGRRDSRSKRRPRCPS